MQNTKHKNGFTVAELLIVLAITGILLAAVAVALNASIINYQENEDIFKAVNSARQALSRMTSQLRTGYWVDPNAPSAICNFFTADGQDITYEHTGMGENKLELLTNSDGQVYTLCENVVAMSFTKTPTDDGSDCKSVQISMTVQSGNVQRTLSAAAVIRRNLE
jgi:prepilin-type N-terminal cleavage/methylation domain-containing protein